VKTCECGCGTMVKRRFAHGHAARTAAGRARAGQMGAARRKVACGWPDLADLVRRTDLSYTMEIEPEFVCPCWKCRAERIALVTWLRQG
jgi:hypothetical protein